MKIAAKLAASLLLAGTCIAQAQAPKNGYVPDEKTAAKIAEAVLVPFYESQNVVLKERIYIATLHDNVWFVHATLPGTHPPGAGPTVKIDKTTGAILGIFAGR